MNRSWKRRKKNIKIKKIKIKFEYQKDTSAGVRWNWWKILEFEAQLKNKTATDIDLPETITGFDGNHNYNDFIDNLDYLMIHRGDFDKFNLSRKNSYPPGFIEEVIFRKLSFSSFGWCYYYKNWAW